MKRLVPYGCLLGALLAATCVAEDFRITEFSRPDPGRFQIRWTNSISSDGYRVQTTTNLLSGSWQTAGDPDDWPRSTTEWNGEANAPCSYFRVQKIERADLQQNGLVEGWHPTQIDFFNPPDYGVELYKLTYTTFDSRGTASTASGALAVPAAGIRNVFPPYDFSTAPTSAIPIVCYQHGTIFLTSDAPSRINIYSTQYAQKLASDGYAVFMADYPGLGDSPPLHPYLHARSEAISAIDLLRAGLDYMTNSLSLEWSGQLFLMGYSQGGHATLALQKELQLNYSNEFTITASAPMAGPHDLSGTMKDQLLSEQEYVVPAFIPYLVFGLNTIYDFYDGPAEWLKEPYATELPPMFDGQHDAASISMVMTNPPKYNFTDEFINDFETNTQNRLRQALRTNDTSTGWVPITPTRFYHCAGDTTVPKANSQVAVSNFWNAGASSNLVSLYDPSPISDHIDGQTPCFNAAKAWFDTLRR